MHYVSSSWSPGRFYNVYNGYYTHYFDHYSTYSTQMQLILINLFIYIIAIKCYIAYYTFYIHYTYYFAHNSSFNSCVGMHWHWLAVVPDDDHLPLEDTAGVCTPPTPPVVPLCDAMQCRVEDGIPEAEVPEEWTDSAGNALPPDRFWNTALETLIAADGE
jgi:hypothetical protein